LLPPPTPPQATPTSGDASLSLSKRSLKSRRLVAFDLFQTSRRDDNARFAVLHLADDPRCGITRDNNHIERSVGRIGRAPPTLLQERSHSGGRTRPRARLRTLARGLPMAAHAGHEFGRLPGDLANCLYRLADGIDPAAETRHPRRIGFFSRCKALTSTRSSRMFA
jgi:hypothetical protein